VVELNQKVVKEFWPSQRLLNQVNGSEWLK